MKREVSIVLVVAIIIAGAASVAVLTFMGSNENNPENINSRLKDLKEKYAGLKENFQEYKESMENRLESLENRILDLENKIGEEKPKTKSYEFSFENGVEKWTARGTDLDDPPIEWSIEPTHKLSSVGDSSLKYKLVNNNDAGKIWIERPFDVQPNRTYSVTVSYDLASMDYGVNLWTIITGAYPDRPLEGEKSKLIFQGDTGTDIDSPENFVWLDKSYNFTVTTDADGEIFVNIGIWGTWETKRFYFVDNVKIKISPLEANNVIEFESNIFDHADMEKPIIENGLIYDIENIEGKNFLTLLTSEENLDLFNFSTIPQTSEDFIKSTDFEKSSLLIFQEFPASSVPDYRIEGISKTGNTVTLFMNNSSDKGTTDITIETVLVKINRQALGSFKKVKIVTEDGSVFRTALKKDFLG